MSRPRVAIIVTGSELVRGERPDANGPFLARESVAHGLHPARIVIVGDAAEDLRRALGGALDADLVLTSGGLGPTHDDRTVEVVAEVTGRELRVDAGLVAEIEDVSRRIAERLRRPYADFEAGVRKQATVPDGALVVGLAGTAPGLALEHESAVVVVLPGPPGELRRLWEAARQVAPVRRVLERARPPGRHELRVFGASESAVARALAEAGGDGDGVEATICARDYEIHVDLLFDDAAAPRADALADELAERLAPYVFAREARSVEEVVLALCRARGLTLATAESCTGGLVAARLTEVPGASDVLLGGVVAYADSLKAVELGVPQELLARHGAVSAEVAAAMARGACRRLGADVAVAVTGIAGPGGGTDEKPVGLVHLHVSAPDGERSSRLELHGDRGAVRRRAAVTALHLVRRLLEQPVDVTLPAHGRRTPA
ncbi:MAG: CinA family nicotinamide mononucleotide deamidase-related protein [Thermoleophilia bacterium]|nr:CinA family nicotinamide mononucleotide deamidase-related protein [Thermoleophilia bacterium]